MKKPIEILLIAIGYFYLCALCLTILIVVVSSCDNRAKMVTTNADKEWCDKHPKEPCGVTFDTPLPTDKTK